MRTKHVRGNQPRVRVRLAALLVAGAAALGLTACNGGTVDRHALTNDSASLDSIACEGALLAHQVGSGGTTHVFTRVHADVLRVQASNFADALGSRDTSAGLEPRVRAKGREAARIAAALEQLHLHPAQRDVAADVEQRLTRIGGCA
jgi:hypothetical protein